MSAHAEVGILISSQLACVLKLVSRSLCLSITGIRSELECTVPGIRGVTSDQCGGLKGS